jgi:hypothetical protein
MVSESREEITRFFPLNSSLNEEIEMSKGMPYPHTYPIPQACANEAEEEEMRKLVREGENLMRESDKLMTAGGDIQEKNRRLGNKNCGELWDEGARIIRESYDVGRRGYKLWAEGFVSLSKTKAEKLMKVSVQLHSEGKPKEAHWIRIFANQVSSKARWVSDDRHNTISGLSHPRRTVRKSMKDEM